MQLVPAVAENLPSHADDLDKVLAEAFRLWARGVADRRSAFRTPTIATVGPDGAPRIRTMVLRRFEPSTRRLTLHTDRRAAKLIDIADHPSVAVHVYDARAALQVRLSARARIHAGDALAREAWAAGAPSSHFGYAITPPPGTEITAPPTAVIGDESGFGNFALVTLTFHTLEWLWLYHGGHRRACFTWADDESHSSAWLVP
jgi:hypothetical protein